MAKSNKRKKLIIKAYKQIINDILANEKQEIKDTFLDLIYCIHNKREIYINVCSSVLKSNLSNFDKYVQTNLDLNLNYEEYQQYLFELVETFIFSDHKKFIKYWNERDKYIMLMDE